MSKDYEPLFAPGHTACAGCTLPVAIRHVTDAAGPNTIVVNATSCTEIISSRYPRTSWKIPYIHAAFVTVASVASGVEAAYKTMDRKTNIIAMAGDGGTFDIGFQALSGMLERGHRVRILDCRQRSRL